MSTLTSRDGTPIACERTAALGWSGRALTAVAALFLLWDALLKVTVNVHVVEALGHLGVPVHLARTIGGLELTLLALTLVPATEVLGAVLLTGFLGGATMLHLRVGDPWPTHVLFASYVGALVWSGLLLRRPQYRILLPFRPARAA